MIYLVGLGNPGEEYAGTRHNTGREVLDYFRRRNKWPDWALDKKRRALVSSGKLKNNPVTLLCPETMMNRSGESVLGVIKSKKNLENLLVVHDDIDLPLGSFKISFARGAGGHRGVDSIIKKLKTVAFTRLRVGIAPTTPSGKIKKPAGETAVVKFILGKFKPSEAAKLKRLFPRLADVVAILIASGRQAAMNQFN